MRHISRSWMLLLGTVALAALAASEEANKKEKSFSIFSVVNFKNAVCTSQDLRSGGSGTNRNGTCYTSSECSSKGGVASGNCASGFGVCCLFKVSSTNNNINQNNTYITNPSFPSVYSATTGLNYKVSKVANNICYLRLDFETFTLLGPSDTVETGGGTCVDALKLTSPTKQLIPSICGKNAGQHIYVDMGTESSDTVSLDFTFSGTSTVRLWDIKTSQIECSNPSRPPSGCLQYFQSYVGRITTFNFADSANTHLASQDYSVCIKQQEGFCCVEYQVCSDQTAPFSLDTVAAEQTHDAKCTLDYVAIPGSSSICTLDTNININNRYCGKALGAAGATPNLPVCDCSAPFRVHIHTDALDDAGIAAPTTGTNTALSRGLCLDYQQIPCTNV